ncbi:MAG: amidohydrolase family protein, partial [Myxococcales bacterium]|nr:amidohydrolase family protein [Myxococcales bacterium]
MMEYVLSFTERPITDTLTALVADNLFGRFPDLRVLSIEYGASWLPALMKKLDGIARLFSKDMWRFGAPPQKPSETLRRNLFIAPFFEDDVPAIVAALGEDHVLSGSDYPHPEGLLWPLEFREELDGLGAPAVRKIMRDNLAGLAAG